MSSDRTPITDNQKPIAVTPPWQRAAQFAARHHQGQTRKDGQTPYVAHAFRVAMTVRDIFGVDEPVALSAALLHDLLEDTPVDYDDICEGFGRDVADIVAALTKDMRMPEAEREEAYDRQLEAANWRAKLVKLADVYDNTCDGGLDNITPKRLDRAERALKLAASDPRLEHATELVRKLIDSGTRNG